MEKCNARWRQNKVRERSMNARVEKEYITCNFKDIRMKRRNCTCTFLVQ